NKFVRSIIAGIVATAVMTAFMFMAPIMGMPEMNPAKMLSGMLGVSAAVGWMMHFIIGIIFAAMYVFFFNPLVHIPSRAGKGLLYGFIVFVFAQVMMFLMSKIMPAPSSPMEGNMLLMMVGSLIGHLVFGLVVGLIVPLEEKGAGLRQDDRLQVT
ncbi:MAG: DUF6789 family protein, partial [Chitinophagaceae bacterium]